MMRFDTLFMLATIIVSERPARFVPLESVPIMRTL